MGKEELKQELGKQIKRKQTAKIICGVFIALSTVLMITIILLPLGIILFIVFIIIGYVIEGQQNKLKVELAKT